MTEVLSNALIFVKTNWISAPEYRAAPYYLKSCVKITFSPDRCRSLSDSGKRPAAESADTTLMLPHTPDVLVRKTAWWPRPESNGHVPLGTTDFKSVASTCSATGPLRAAFHRHHSAHSQIKAAANCGARIEASSALDWRHEPSHSCYQVRQPHSLVVVSR